MKIIALVKQVPDSTEIRVDKVTGTLIRAGVPSIINPDDLAGVEEALKIKETKDDVTVTVISMGPPQASGMLKELLARGVDECVLITDRAFAGADTCATSSTLAAAIEKIGYDLIIAGRQAIDGDTAQVGPQTAERLDIPQVTYVDKIIDINDKVITVRKSLEDSEEIIEAKLPCLLTTLSGMNTPRYMNCNDIVDSFNKEVKIMTFNDLGIDASKVGLAGSPTKVHHTFTKDVTAETETYELPAGEAAKLIAKTLKEKQIITK
ncbi:MULTISPECIES: electron transfer flavoprotein subunit beta/FixA family protein [Bacillota]|uniref:Electron transfer flavoprotein small subunit n=2 Tax=Amedibacillus TaxID=2749846 RepID=A0A7G9GMS1_9FIRM|nr:MULTISPECIES: electron transfer flavoprotein subunit beta/FixA family protein [Bacillota]QNM12103.1 electron transfer flavoprotein subunit beta/FixA family protein [[Eubacterium] hominis]MCH4286544.1 electron transfer flavoprotein subunit beta/FixA family protein [Amedibacillus hominis]RGB53169.1 electron transfer flavoprotein subunit beta/FixA family protein [Absiella sp. AM22-9]RGB59459.1 electron transfer flavoprotein subunit beta/FixA family protein [Absiella sp. AM10-20]RGB66568.1 elec